MRKIYIRTSDIFDYKDAEKRMKHLTSVVKKLWNAVLYVVRILMA